MTIINDDSRVVNKLEASLTDDARLVIYNGHMFIVQATEKVNKIKITKKKNWKKDEWCWKLYDHIIAKTFSFGKEWQVLGAWITKCCKTCI